MEAQPPQPHVNLTTSHQCLAITNHYYGSSISMAATILELQGQLNNTDEHFESSLGSYIWILNNFGGSTMVHPAMGELEPGQILG